MEIVVDTNRIIAALIKDSFSRKAILSAKFSFYTVEFGVQEVRKYEGLIKQKAKINDQEFEKLMQMLLPKIIVVNEQEISKSDFSKAIKALGKVDYKDVPFLALALHLGNKPIWTDDPHFKKQRRAKVITTKQIVQML